MLLRCLVTTLLLACVQGVCAGAAILPACIPPTELSRGKVTRIEHDGILALQDGRAVRLEGIMLPAGASDHAPEFLAAEAIAALSNLARGRMAILAAQPPKEDRYGRLRAQLLLPDHAGALWLQLSMLRRGLARVSIAPDRRECASELYAAETGARIQKAGIWSAAAYVVRTPVRVPPDTGTFQIVEGLVESVTN
jgi:micrococcal nuclease